MRRPGGSGRPCRDLLDRRRADRRDDAYTAKVNIINNMGSVAKSGTTYLLEAMAEGAGTHLIGKFGIGFYSAFLVASRDAVTFKCNVDPV